VTVITNDQTPQRNDHSSVFTCNCSPVYRCVGWNAQQAKLKHLQNEYDEFKEIVTKPKTPILTYNKQTNLIGRFMASDIKLRTYSGLLSR